MMILKCCQDGENIDYYCCEFQFVDPQLVWVILWEVIDSTVYFWVPRLPAYLPPVAELTRTTAHVPARRSILSNACIWFAIDEVT